MIMKTYLMMRQCKPDNCFKYSHLAIRMRYGVKDYLSFLLCVHIYGGKRFFASMPHRLQNGLKHLL